MWRNGLLFKRVALCLMPLRLSTTKESCDEVIPRNSSRSILQWLKFRKTMSKVDQPLTGQNLRSTLVQHVLRMQTGER